MNALTAAGKTEGRCKGLRRGTNHACRSLHVVNAAQVLEVEEVQRGRGLRVCRRGRPLTGRTSGPSRSHTASAWAESSTARRSERGPEEAKCPPLTKQEGAGGRGTLSEKEARSSDMSSEKPSGSVRLISTGSEEADC